MNAVEQLRKVFSFTSSVIDTAGGKSILEVESQWKGDTEGVAKVVLYLSGTDSISGKTLSEEKVRFEFSAVNTRGKTGTVDYYGNYLLHADAYLSNGDIVRDFNPPVPVIFSSSSGKPYITYFSFRAPKGWTGIEIEANCWRRCNGKLWAQFDGSTQLIPNFMSNTLHCLLPVDNKEFVIVSADPNLPKPEKTKKEG